MLRFYGSFSVVVFLLPTLSGAVTPPSATPSVPSTARSSGSCVDHMTALGNLLHAALVSDGPTRTFAAAVLGRPLHQVVVGDLRSLQRLHELAWLDADVSEFWKRLMRPEETRGDSFIAWYRGVQTQFKRRLEANADMRNWAAWIAFFQTAAPRPFGVAKEQRTPSKRYIYSFGHALLPLESDFVMLRNRFGILLREEREQSELNQKQLNERWALATAYFRLLNRFFEAQRHFDLDGPEGELFGHLARLADFLPDDMLVELWLEQFLNGETAAAAESLTPLSDQERKERAELELSDEAYASRRYQTYLDNTLGIKDALQTLIDLLRRRAYRGAMH